MKGITMIGDSVRLEDELIGKAKMLGIQQEILDNTIRTREGEKRVMVRQEWVDQQKAAILKHAHNWQYAVIVDTVMLGEEAMQLRTGVEQAILRTVNLILAADYMRDKTEREKFGTRGSPKQHQDWIDHLMTRLGRLGLLARKREEPL